MLRRSVSVLVILLACIAVLWPAMILMIESFTGEGGDSPLMHDPWILTVETLAWSIGIAIGAMLIGWLPGHVLAACIQSRPEPRGPRRWLKEIGLIGLFAAILLPLLVPSYAIFYAWWQTWPSGSWLFDLLERSDAIGLGRRFTLAIGLLCWSWPLVSLCVAASAATWPRSRDDQLETDGASFWNRIRARWHHDAGGLLLGGLLVASFTFANVICFDLAGVFTLGNELRALAAMQADPVQMVAVSLPAATAAVLGAMITWWGIGRIFDDASVPRTGIGKRTGVLTLLIWIVTACIPAALIFVHMDERGLELWAAHGPAIARDGLYAILLGIMASVVFLGMLWLLRSPVRSWRRFGSVLSMLWIAMLLAPGSLVAIAILAGIAWVPSNSLKSWLLRSGAALLLGWLAKFGGIAVLGARWISSSEPEPLQDLRRIHGGSWASDGLRTWAAAIAIAAMASLLALGEIPIAMRLSPPATSPPISVTLLNAMHYQRPQTVIAVLAMFIVIGFLMAIGIGLLVRTSHAFRTAAGKTTMLCLVCLPLITTVGCSDSEPVVPRLDVSAVLGGPGHSTGRFNYPRAMAIDPNSHDLYVIEKSGRVQRLDAEGRPLADWMMPRVARGRPTGISVASDGTVWIPDTHEHRIMIYTSTGELLDSFGGYGDGPGQFMYPTDIEFGPDGLVYVAEYGGNDRIQVFTSEGVWIRTLGGPGNAPGQFDRPQSITMADTGDRLYVADSRNRRIQQIDVLTGEGRVVLQGAPGEQLSIPFGLIQQADGTLLVTDIGSNCLLVLDANGHIIDARGGWGWETGQLRDPWAVVQRDEAALVLDSGNNRILVIDDPQP